MNATELMAKANQALASAKLLLDTGDADGACNRAYYAMFDAARAACWHQVLRFPLRLLEHIAA